MRIASASAIIVSALTLAACGGGGGSTTASGISNLGLDCGLDCLPTTGTGSTGGTGTGTGGGTGTGTGTTAGTVGGNTTSLSTGDTTIALESNKLAVPAGGGSSQSVLSATTAEILAATKPTKMKFAIDTNTSTNGAWPVPILMDEYAAGTNVTFAWDANNKGGAGAGYREYRIISGQPGNQRDETLQLWAWGNSYATQYRNVNGGKAVQQAWSFGGNKTALTAMPLGGSATYAGKWVGTATTSNWVKVDNQPIDPNADWRVQGSSVINTNFGTGAVTGTLSPETWTSYQPDLKAWFTQVVQPNATLLAAAYIGNTPRTQGNFHYYNEIYDNDIKLQGAITGNTYKGTATIVNRNPNIGYITGDNPMYGAFFGANAQETTGIFSAFGTLPVPIGGAAGVNGDLRGYLTINGAFNGTCTPGVTCAP